MKILRAISGVFLSGVAGALIGLFVGLLASPIAAIVIGEGLVFEIRYWFAGFAIMGTLVTWSVLMIMHDDFPMG